jgi:hypothetical protein
MPVSEKTSSRQLVNTGVFKLIFAFYANGAGRRYHFG